MNQYVQLCIWGCSSYVPFLGCGWVSEHVLLHWQVAWGGHPGKDVHTMSGLSSVQRDLYTATRGTVLALKYPVVVLCFAHCHGSLVLVCVLRRRESVSYGTHGGFCIRATTDWSSKSEQQLYCMLNYLAYTLQWGGLRWAAGRCANALSIAQVLP